MEMQVKCQMLMLMFLPALGKFGEKETRQKSILMQNYTDSVIKIWNKNFISLVWYLFFF